MKSGQFHYPLCRRGQVANANDRTMVVAKVEGLLFLGGAVGSKAFGVIEGYQGSNTRVPIFTVFAALYAASLVGVVALPESLAPSARRQWPGWSRVCRTLCRQGINVIR